MKFTIYGRLNSANEYINACKGHYRISNGMKKKNQKVIRQSITERKQFENPVSLNITWYEPNAKRDIDNVCFSVKFILDALVEMQIIKNDTQKFVKSINHTVEVDKTNPRVEVEIIERGQNETSL